MDTFPQIQHPKKKNFLELYRETRGFISDVTRAVGIDRSTYYNWLDSDKDFAQAIAECEAEVNDEMRDALIRKGGEGDMTAIIFWLKNRHPDFKQGQNNIQVNILNHIQKEKSEFGI